MIQVGFKKDYKINHQRDYLHKKMFGEYIKKCIFVKTKTLNRGENQYLQMGIHIRI